MVLQDVVQVLLAIGVDVNIKDNMGSTALQEACKNGHTHLVRLLTSKGGRFKFIWGCLMAWCNLTTAIGYM